MEWIPTDGGLRFVQARVGQLSRTEEGPSLGRNSEEYVAVICQFHVESNRCRRNSVRQ